jgi:hypothetical protein
MRGSLLINDDNYRSIEKPRFFTNYFLDMTALRSIFLFFDFDNPVYASDMEDFITQFPFWLQGCKQLSEVKVEIPTYGLNNPWRNNLMQGVLRRAFKQTGVMGRFLQMVSSRPEYGSSFTEAELWTWKATDGQLMDWSREIGWKCKKRCSVVVPPAWTFWGEWCELGFGDNVFFVEWWENPTPYIEAKVTVCCV